ncbi:hypothetical protein A2803_04335 [Candidatus Woesebacteria bacterium RIFCSPHIGHO2_01_FULL_44_21]|uniref:DUF4258 domain-containing protein n=1 Tax=Candidatus Woesebacteria bacterium RIFCSPHIGHO2_01_FULL_44_21 TaxID=1802503 RepID=A0A1F7Z2V1_9BACT|nr:MAG: hypothetical protein A2803_04335 [Candidatus Woesebacteria bacterium RIFCSPHIGHO2_01_FULL_44_21]OGM71496.1 MAG: hypothetical protein A2897_04220 [Candidatus Woesebacteria bacterium RIFCSPLOWO2_01_FULL_44_24b]
MKIIYRPHLKRRLKERKFPDDYPHKIYKEAKFRFFDTQTKHHIAIAKMEYADKLRNLSISYDKIGNKIEIITIHPISDEDIKSRIKSKRWQKK